MSSINPDDSPRHRFAYELRRYRLRAGLTQLQLARQVPCSGSQIAHLENARRIPQERLVRRFDEILPVPPNHFLTLYSKMDSDSASEQALATDEQAATGLKIWCAGFVWEVFQTEEYARVLFTSDPCFTAEEIDGRMAEYLRRKGMLNQTRPPRIQCLMDEGVLHRLVGGPDVMRRQLESLVETAQLPYVTIQVVPYGSPSASIGLRGEFHIGERDGTAYIARMESVLDGSWTTDPAVIARLAERYDAIRGDAHNRQMSLQILKDKLQDWSRG